jgi:hypothetical protein
VRLVTPCDISWPAMSSATSGRMVAPLSPSPKVMQKQPSLQNAFW